MKTLMLLCVVVLSSCAGMDPARVAAHAQDIRELRDSSAPPIVRIHQRMQAAVAAGASDSTARLEVGAAALLVGQETVLMSVAGPASRPAR